ncbi:MAG: helix-turn-helix domain-containing protein [Ilumatobacter sp.]
MSEHSEVSAQPDIEASGADILPFPSNGRGSQSADAPGEPLLRDVLGDVLRDERHRQNRTLADVADDAAVSLPYLSEVERGVKEVSSDVLESITRSLDLTLDEVLERGVERLRIRPQRDARFELRAA